MTFAATIDKHRRNPVNSRQKNQRNSSRNIVMVNALASAAKQFKQTQIPAVVADSVLGHSLLTARWRPRGDEIASQIVGSGLTDDRRRGRRRQRAGGLSQSIAQHQQHAETIGAAAPAQQCSAACAESSALVYDTQQSTFH
jgi:hypothetical protein